MWCAAISRANAGSGCAPVGGLGLSAADSTSAQSATAVAALCTICASHLGDQLGSPTIPNCHEPRKASAYNSSLSPFPGVCRPGGIPIARFTVTAISATQPADIELICDSLFKQQILQLLRHSGRNMAMLNSPLVGLGAALRGISTAQPGTGGEGQRTPSSAPPPTARPPSLPDADAARAIGAAQHLHLKFPMIRTPIAKAALSSPLSIVVNGVMRLQPAPISVFGASDRAQTQDRPAASNPSSNSQLKVSKPSQRDMYSRLTSAGSIMSALLGVPAPARPRGASAAREAPSPA